jgi:hypothetical protein
MQNLLSSDLDRSSDETHSNGSHGSMSEDIEMPQWSHLQTKENIEAIVLGLPKSSIPVPVVEYKENYKLFEPLIIDSWNFVDPSLRITNLNEEETNEILQVHVLDSAYTYLKEYLLSYYWCDN